MYKSNKSNIKLIFSVLMTVIVLFSFTACSKKDPSSSSESSSSSSSQSSSSEPAKPPVKPEKEILDKIAAAEKINSDVVGWITIPNTPVDAEVLQKPGDNIFYERKDITKNYNWYGCYYADGGNTFGDRDKLTRNTIIYAHNMGDDPKTTNVKDQKFSQLLRYNDLEWATNNPYVYFSTPEDDMVWEIYAAYYTDISFQYHLEKPNDSTFENIIKEAKLRSEMIYDVDVTKDDKILTLSTCTYKFQGGEKNKEQRYVVQAKLVKTGEKLKDKASVKKNPSPKQPTFSKKY